MFWRRSLRRELGLARDCRLDSALQTAFLLLQEKAVAERLKMCR